MTRRARTNFHVLSPLQETFTLILDVLHRDRDVPDRRKLKFLYYA